MNSVRPLDEALLDFERGFLGARLFAARGNVSKFALGIGRARTDVYKLLARVGLDPHAPEFDAARAAAAHARHRQCVTARAADRQACIEAGRRKVAALGRIAA